RRGGPLQRRRQRGRIGADVVDLRPCALLRLAHLNLLARHEARDFRPRIVEGARPDRTPRTDNDTRRPEGHLPPGGARVALGGGSGVWIDIQRVVWTALHARLASDAARAVEIDDAICAAIERDGRANGDTGRVVAVVAPQHREIPPRVRPGALLDVLDPRAERPERHLVFFLAGHRAGGAADTLTVVDHKAVAHSVSLIRTARATRRARR